MLLFNHLKIQRKGKCLNFNTSNVTIQQKEEQEQEKVAEFQYI